MKTSFTGWRPRRSTVLTFAMLIASTTASAQLIAQAEKDKNSSKPSAATTKINRWIEQLTDDSSTARDAARENLVAAGGDAIAPLKSAATNGDPQTAYSSLRLLAEMVSRRDNALSAKAKQAVTEITEGKSPSARQAKKILEQVPLEKRTRRNGNINPPGGIGSRISISKSTINDSERVVVKENDRKIEILRDPRRIVVTIQDADGKESVFKANTEAELKKASKLAWDLVDKYLNQQNGVQIAVGQLKGGRFGRAGLDAFQMNPSGNNPIVFDPFGHNRRRPGQKDSLKEITRLLKEAKDVATEAKKERDLDKLQSILDKLDHMETHLELLRRERGQ